MVSTADIAPYISLAFLFIVGLGLGASTTFDDFRKAAKKPKAVGIGFLSQYLFMPLAAYLLTVLFQLDTDIAIGAVLIGCSPGGTTSNLFTYWSFGDVALSITMSFLSTCAAFLLMPFWIWILVQKALGSTAQVAWGNMIMSLLLILIPTTAGLWIRRVNTRTKIGSKFVWQWVELFSTIFGIVFLLASVAVAIVAYGNLFQEMPWEAWVTAAIMQPLGCLFGYGMSHVVGFGGKDKRTISLETGIQSFSLTVAVVQLSFASDDDDNNDLLMHALMFPVGYGFLYLLWSPAIVLLFRYYLAPKDEQGLIMAQQDGQEGTEEEQMKTNNQDKTDSNNKSSQEEEEEEMLPAAVGETSTNLPETDLEGATRSA